MKCCACDRLLTNKELTELSDDEFINNEGLCSKCRAIINED